MTIIPRDARMKDGKKRELGDSNKIEVEVEKVEEKRVELPMKKGENHKGGLVGN